MIQLSDVTRRFGCKEVLRSLNFELRPGEVSGLLGHNGAGKTTTLRLITGLLGPSAGSISRPPDFKRSMGFLPDEPFLFDYLTGREMLYFMGALYGLPRTAIRERVQRLLGLFELDREADQLLKAYSRGMRRKVSLIGSILHDPEYWLLDEPTESLDPLAVKNLKDLVRLRRSRGGAILISTHQLPLVESLCDRMLVLHHGNLIFDGSMEQMQSVVNGRSTLEEVYLHLLSACSAGLHPLPGTSPEAEINLQATVPGPASPA